MNQSVSERKKLHRKIVKAGEKVKLIKPKFAFGKYKGKTVDFVLKNDPHYIVWCYRTVAKTYWPKGLDEELYKRCLGITKEYKPTHRGLGPADYDDIDYGDPGVNAMEQWAREIADE